MLSDDLLSEYRVIDAQRVFILCVVLNALRVLTAKRLMLPAYNTQHHHEHEGRYTPHHLALAHNTARTAYL